MEYNSRYPKKRDTLKSREPVEVKPKVNVEALRVDPDRLEKPIIFISSKANDKIKIPTARLGEKWVKNPPFAKFDEKHKYVCTSKYVAGVLRSHCSPLGVLELKG